MEINPTVEQARNIARQSDNAQPNESSAYLERAEEMLLDYLKINPRDTQAWLILAMIEWTPPLEDFARIIKWMRNILEYDPTNPYALLVFAEAHWFFGGIDQAGYDLVCNAKSDDKSVMAMIEVAKADYFDRKNDNNRYEEALKKSIEYAPEHVKNYRMLGELYKKQGKVAQAEKLFEKAKENEEKASLLESDEYDITSLTAFLNEWYTGL